ncbi:ATP-dependent RecD-like DNA helicase (plasmid) [Corynebacterium occultum]|uniref:ATP-dependent RecD-like DNA helicase n=2 Tax=Corynebacterium occultum TaxID=2675219 RepID=A0A6B8WRD4_9CORY|nr:ATP-dependent RecD-like DNA helicase [Corynebacterium occultum]
MSVRVINAGDGYAYLLDSVAAHDDTSSAGTSLSDYYQATGTPPGRWFGHGITGLGATTIGTGVVVGEVQMAALYGEGLHPDADHQMLHEGATIKDVQLGRRFPLYTQGVPVLGAIKQAEAQFLSAHQRRPTTKERTALGLEVARPHYETAHGVTTSSPREVLAWLNEEKNKVKQATSGVDLTFSPQKSVSVLWALGDEETRQAIEEIHQETVTDCLSWIEDHVLFTRTGHRGERQLKARGMIAATFVHFDTRAGDPDLHTHCLISNKVQADPETPGMSRGDVDKWRSVDASHLLKNSALIGQRYQHLLTQRLNQRLGLEFRPRVTAEEKQPVWEVAGIDDGLIEQFSSRRTMARPVYESYAADYASTHGHAPSDRVRYRLWQQAILDTRDAKKPAQSLAEHRTRWAALADGQVLSAQRLAATAPARQVFPEAGTEAYQEAVAFLAHQATEDTRGRRAEFYQRHLTTSITMRLHQWRFTSEEVAEQARQDAVDWAREHLIVALTPPADESLPAALLREDGRVIDQDADSVMLTAKATLAEEARVLDAIDEPTAYLATHTSVTQALEKHAAESGLVLNQGQQLLVSHLTESGAQLTAGVGPAGTGKTAAMAVVASLWQAHDRQVIALAPSATAAQHLGADIGTEGHTLASLTYRWRGIIGNHPQSLDHLGVSLTPGDMLLVDEAGMATTADLAALVEIAQTSGAVVRLVGDPHQLDAVETGGLFRTLVKRDQSVELDQVMRMGADTDQAHAGLRLRHGDGAGLDLYHQRGWVHHGARVDMVAGAAQAHLADEQAGHTGILIASTRADVDTANHIIRDTRCERGLVDTEGPQVTLGTGHQAAAGDVILTRRNQTVGGQRVLNGQRFTITQVHADGSLVVTGEQRRRPLVLPGSYVAEHVQLGYAATVHRAQGVTVDITRAIVGPGTDRRGLYVAATRGKKQNHLYVTEDTRIDLESEDGHWHMSGEHHAPNYRDILKDIMARDDGHDSAHDLHRAELAHATSPERTKQLLATATGLLTTSWRRTQLEPEVRDLLDSLPATLTASVDEDQAVERIATSAVRLARHGINYRDLVGEATANLEGARDVAAVIAHRLDHYLPDTQPELAALPPRHIGHDVELYDWAHTLHAELAGDTARTLRPLDAPLPERGEIHDRDFRHTDLRGLELSGVKFIDCDFRGAAFDDTDFHQVTFKSCQLQGASFTSARFGVDDGPFRVSPLIHCDLDGADFRDAQLVRLSVTRCSLTNACFTGTILGGHFHSADFTGVDFTGAQVNAQVGVSDCVLDAHAPAALHQAQAETVADRERARQTRRNDDSAAQETYAAPTIHQQVFDHTPDGPEL